jgi:hypothetical protein
MNYTSKILVGAEYAQQHAILDIDNRVILSMRSFKFLASTVLPESLQFAANLIPKWLKMPQFILDIVSSKFN